VSYSLGVDVGTTYTAVGIARAERAEIAPLGSRGWSVPSVVFVCADQTVLIGEPALRRAATDPLRVAREFKRRIGDPVPLMIGRSPMSADALTGLLLQAVVEQIVTLESGPPEHLVLTHPANWGPYKTDVLRQAARLASLDRLCPVSLMTEPEAAAAFYASTERLSPGDIVAVYDLGGGTFDAAVLRRTETGWQFPAPAEGIERLGGIDFDEAVVNHVDTATGGAVRDLDPTDPESMAALLQLRRECVEAKEALSSDVETTIRVALPGLHRDVRLTRSEFEDMIEPPVRLSVDTLRHVLDAAGVAAGDLRAVLLVGGSSRIPLVSQIVGQTLRVPVAVDAHPKHSVALGAALTAARRARPVGPSGRPASMSTPSSAVPGRAESPVAERADGPGRSRRTAFIAGTAALVAAVAIGTVLLVRGNVTDRANGQAAAAPATSAAAGAVSSGPTDSTGATDSTGSTGATGAAGPTGSSGQVAAGGPTLPRSAPLAENQLLVQADATASDGSTVQHMFLAEVGNPRPVRDLTPGDVSVNGIGLTADRRTMSWRQEGDPTDVFRVAAADGTDPEVRTLTVGPEGCADKPFRPAWDPADPSRFAATCRPGRGPLITVYDADGTAIGRLDTGEETFTDVTFTADGRSIVYSAEEQNGGDGGALWRLDASGTEPAVALTQPTMPGQDADAAISPDGSTVAFRRRSDPSGGRNFDIWLMDVDGTNQRPLLTGAPDDQDPAWSPDGTSIAFKSNRTDGAAGVGNRDRVWLIALSDGAITPLWGDDVPGSQTTPAWAYR